MSGAADTAEPLVLSAIPDWHAAAGELVSGLLGLDDADARIRLLERFCERLGQQLYPAFLQILHVVARNGDANAHRLVAATLVDGLLSGRLPSGHLAAWGSSGASGDPAFGQRRRLGPIEYLCAWYAQPSERRSLDRAAFARALESLLGLLGADERARRLYAGKLAADAADPLGGSLASATRAALAALAARWSADADPWDVTGAFLDALDEERTGSFADTLAGFRPPGGY